MRRYRSGCGCALCRAKNAEKSRNDRARRRALTAKPTAPAGPIVVVTTAERDHARDESEDDDGPTFTYEPGFENTVHGQLEAALREIENTTALISFRKTHALQLARVLDDVTKPHLWAPITKSLHEVLGQLIVTAGGGEGESSPEAELLAQFMAAFGPASRG